MDTTEQKRYDALAALEESNEGAPTGGASAHGADAAAIGRALIEQARNVGGRPKIGGASGAGPSPVMRARVHPDAKARFLAAILATTGITEESEALRIAMNEYVDNHA